LASPSLAGAAVLYKGTTNVESNNEIVRAIHELELRLNAGLALNTTALEVNNERLQNLKEAVERHATVLYGHEENDHPGLITRIAKIEQADTERKWSLRTVVIAFVSLAGKVVYDFISSI
jgi:hypothetical protein